MLFNSIEYLLFLPLVTAALLVLPLRLRTAFLVSASYAFYACWCWPYVFLIAGVTLVSYAGAIWIQATPAGVRRRTALGVTVTITLSALCYLKYSAFVLDSLLLVADRIQTEPARLPTWVLPVGISFYTLQAVGYVMDVYRGKSKAERSLLHYALFIAFFPQLVAGPIERAGHLLAQFRQRAVFCPLRIASGLQLILWGLFKKVVIADRLAYYVDRIYAEPSLYNGPTLLLASYFFAFQIYCDFSGYSDMAIGSARLLGIDLMRNFRMPYLATSIRDFWRRWHISLSTWFRDYVYIPLGGSRRTHWGLAALAVFVLSGLWHGANLTFVVWGAFHGALYLGERHLQRFVPEKLMRISRARNALKRIVTFHAVLAGWVLFRSPTLADAGTVFQRLPGGWNDGLYIGASQATMALSLGLVTLLMAVQAWQYVREQNGAPLWVALPWRWASMILMIIGVAILGIGDRAFIYFQF